MAAAWISRRDAIALVAAAQGPDVLSRSGARSTLAEWVRAGLVRTKATTARPPGCKHFRRLYRRADITRRLAARRRRREWQPHEDALLGTDYDHVIARKLRRTLASVAWRRGKLGIAPHGPSAGARCDPGSWRRAPDDPRLQPPLRATG